MTWAAVLALAAGTYAFRLGGVLLRGRVLVGPRVERAIDLGATGLLVALVATATFVDGGAAAGWARPAGVLMGAVLAWRRVPFVLVVVLAAATTAGLRALGVP